MSHMKHPIPYRPAGRAGRADGGCRPVYTVYHMISPVYPMYISPNYAQIRRPSVERLLDPLWGDRVYPIPLPPFPAGPLSGQMAKSIIGLRP